MKKLKSIQDTFLMSHKDKKIFFHALLHPKKPNEKLQKGVKRYNDAIKQKLQIN